MKHSHFLPIVLAAFLSSVITLNAADKTLKNTIAEDHTILSEDEWYGFHRIKFDFEGYEAWVVEPSVETAPGTPWTWTMQWAEAFVNRTGVLELLAKGFHHATIDLYKTLACDESMPVFAAYQEYLTGKLGFAPKANLVGLSWGGFFSIRYAAAYPENVRRIYLDAPLLNFDGFKMNLGPWEGTCTKTFWSEDPRMPVNMAGAIAKAGIPILLIYGGHDQTVNPALNCERFLSRLKDAGGSIKIIYRSLFGHHPHGLDPGYTGEIIEFFSEGE